MQKQRNPEKRNNKFYKNNISIFPNKNLENILHIKISDKGVGIKNLDEALEPFFTTGEDEERSGMGFTIIKSFMDGFSIESALGKGTTVYMSKCIKSV